MSNFTLDDIRAAAEAKYGSTDIEVDGEVIRLSNPLRLSADRRSELLRVQKALADGDENTDQVRLLSEAIKIVAASPEGAEQLLVAIDGDLAILIEVFGAYSEGTQAGEA